MLGYFGFNSLHNLSNYFRCLEHSCFTLSLSGVDTVDIVEAQTNVEFRGNVREKYHFFIHTNGKIK